MKLSRQGKTFLMIVDGKLKCRIPDLIVSENLTRQF